MDLGGKLFSFAVIADTHVNQEEGRASSDFAVNALSNARNRHVMQRLRRERPEFVLHLGDIVHPTPSHPGYERAAAAFRELASILDCPIHLTPGNHDVGDKPGDWLPVPSVSEEALALYDRTFGRNFYAFDAHGCHVVVIDAQVLNSGLACEAAQREWLERDLAAHAGSRIFLCTHYPPYLLEPGEPGHYDNLDEPGRSWLLGLIERHGVEAVFAGHVHNFWYHRHGETEIYLLPSTAFVRLDYSELYRVEPGPERGRNDAPKLGYLRVDVHERGHVAHAIRTDGACLGPGEALAADEALGPVHARSISRSPLGIDLRHPWAEVTEVAASGAVDEFSRKAARNDYPVMALWEMGIRKLRVPISDLLDSRVRDRMRALQRVGHEFTVYTHGVPEPRACEVLVGNADLVARWEVIAPIAGIESVAERVAVVRVRAPLATRLSKLRRPGDALHHGERARHVIEHGFLPAERERIGELFRPGSAAHAAFDGLLFRVARGESPWETFPGIRDLAAGLGVSAQAYVRLAAENPAQACDDDRANANRVAEAMFAALACPGLEAWLDTFDDVDRGYFPRRGLVDRRFNPRMAGRVCRHLNSALSEARPDAAVPGADPREDGRILTLGIGPVLWALALPERAMLIEELRLAQPHEVGSTVASIDLVGGSITRMRCASGAAALRLERAVACEAPVLFRIEAA
jgi:hypothetical protein